GRRGGPRSRPIGGRGGRPGGSREAGEDLQGEGAGNRAQEGPRHGREQRAREGEGYPRVFLRHQDRQGRHNRSARERDRRSHRGRFARDGREGSRREEEGSPRKEAEPNEDHAPLTDGGAPGEDVSGRRGGRTGRNRAG